MANIYRKSALEKISSPEQLDKALVVTSPLSWLALAAVTIMIIATIIWSVVGTIPVTVSAPGIISSPANTNAVYMQGSGKVESVLVRESAELKPGTPILTYLAVNGDVNTVYSDQYGYVESVMVKKGDSVAQGSELVRVSPIISGSQVVVCYVNVNNVSKIERDKRANVFLSGADSQSYGHMNARVINVDSFASSVDSMSYVLGKNNNRTNAFMGDGSAVVAVTLELYYDSTHSTVSGYYWSNPKGAKVSVDNGTPVEVKIIVEEVAPITKLFTKLRDLWGD